MEKVKITQEQADAVQQMVTRYSKPNVIRGHITGARGGEFQPLNEMPLHDLIQAVYIGYEVEETFEVGSWVVVDWNDTGEKTYQVKEIGKDNRIKIEDCLFPPFRIVRHATPEEIKAEKERRLWKSIGREVGEFREGDAIRSAKGMTHGLRSENDFLVARGRYERKEIKGFYPTETFVDFGGENDD